MLRVLFAIFVTVLLSIPSSTYTASAASCEFILGFKAIHDAMPDVVGSCSVDEHHNPTNGDGLQETSGKNGSGGLMVWRKADNWTAYTDGYRTWINGPNGLQQRLNTERFTWENDGSTAPAATAPPAQPAAPPTAQASVGVPPADKDNCPAAYPIKGNRGAEWIYHIPGGRSYSATDPEECFVNEASAQTAGYRPASR